MKIKDSVIALILLLAVVLPGCGGGGSGGGSGSEGVRILHAGIDSAPFLLSSSANPEEVRQTAKFAMVEGYFGLSGGEQIVSAACVKGVPIFSFSIPKERSARQTILVYGGRSTGSGVKAALLEDEAGEILDGMSAVRVIHGVDGAGSITASAGGVTVGQNVALGAASPYAMVPSGIQAFAVQASSGAVLYSGSGDFQSGRAYSLFAAGEKGYLVLVRVTED